MNTDVSWACDKFRLKLQIVVLEKNEMCLKVSLFFMNKFYH